MKPSPPIPRRRSFAPIALAVLTATLSTLAPLAGQDTESPEVTPLPNPNRPTAPTQPEQPAEPGQPGQPQAPGQPDPGQPQAPGARPEQQLDRTFLLAQNAFQGGSFADAGGILFKGAALAEASGDPTQADLAEAVASLRILAYDVASQEIGDPTRLDRAYAATHHALSRQAYLESSGAWAERRIRTASQKLAATSYHLGRSIEWGGREPSSAGRQTLALADQVAAEIAASESVPVPNARVAEAYEQIGAMIPATGATLEQDREDAGGTDNRVEDAAQRAVEGIRSGTRKAAEKVGEKLSDFGRFLQGN
ncbi:hypothetical protein BH23VER1_BH23VER1_12930 [soil metagenome]